MTHIARVEVDKNTAGRPETIRLFSGTRKLALKMEWDDSGVLRVINFEGDRTLLPIPQEQLKLFMQQWLERIALIHKVDEITLLDTINTITDIERIGRIEDAVITPTIIRNSYWQLGDLSYWDGPTSYVTLVTTVPYLGTYAALGIDMSGELTQRLTSPVSSDEIEALVIAATRDATYTDDLDATIYYSDGTETTTTHTTAVGWALYSLAPAAGKIIRRVGWTNHTAGNGVYVGLVALVRKAANIKHDKQTYKSVQASLNADGNLVAGVANKFIKLHSLYIQAAATVEGDIKDKSGGTAFIHFKLQDREGVVLSFHPYPAFIMKSQAAGDPLYVDFSTAAQCYFTAVYTDADAS